MKNYFVENPTYPKSYFRRRFRMSTDLFRRIAEKLASHDRFFQQRRNDVGELGHSTFLKVTAALRMLAYGIPADLVDDHLAMGESQAIMCVKRFAVGIVQVFSEEYLTSPTAEDAARLLVMNKARGFSWHDWLNRLHALELEELSKGMAWAIPRPNKGYTIILEAVADQETWI